MPRPFAVIGFTMFAVLAVLSVLGISAVPFFAVLFTLGLVFSVIKRDCLRQKVLPTAFAVALLSCVLFSVFWNFDYAEAVKYDGECVELSGSVNEKCDTGSGKSHYIISVNTINGHSCDFNVRLSTSSPVDASIGDNIFGEFKVFRLGNNSDAERYYMSQSCYLGVYPQPYDNSSINVSRNSSGLSLTQRFSVIRRNICNSLSEIIPGDEGKLAVSVLLGETGYLSEGIRSNFNSCGISHIVCVSGLHLSVWSSALYLLLRKLKANKVISGIVSILFVCFFMALTGFGYSVCRAGIMLIICYLSLILSKNYDSINSLGLSAVVLLLINPFSAGSVGFQLSFLATAGILILLPLVSDVSKRFLLRFPHVLYKPLNYIFSAVCTVLAVTVFTLPVVFQSDGCINFASFPANVIIVPFASLCMISSGACAAFTSIPAFSFVKYLSAYISYLSARLVIFLSSVFSKLDFLRIFPDRKLMYLFFTVIFFLACIAFILQRNIRFSLLRFGSVGFSLLIVLLVCTVVQNASTTKLTFFDRGKSLSALITSRNGDYLIGCGYDESCFCSSLPDKLRSVGVADIDALIIPSNKKSICGSLSLLSSEMNIDKMMYHNYSADSDYFLMNTDKVFLSENCNAQLCDGVSAYISSVDDCCYAFLNADGVGILIICDSDCDLSLIKQEYLNADILVLNGSCPDGIDLNRYSAVIVNDNKSDIFGPNVYVTGDNGDITATIFNNRKIKLNSEF